MCVFYLTVLTICVFLVEGNATVTGYWTQWYDEDSPRDGIGDIETIEAIEQRGSAICDEQYTAFGTECRTHNLDEWLVFREDDADLAPDKLHNPCTKTGLECRNADQPMETTCMDYQVRFYCVLQGKDIIKEDNSSTIALAAGLTFLFPIIVALIINICKRYCCKARTNQLPIVTGSSNNLNSDQQALFDPPPSYNFLFGHPQTSSSAENLLVNPSMSVENEESTSTRSRPNQISIHTLPSSNFLPTNSVSVTEADNCYRQFRDRIKRFPGMHLSVMDLYNHYQDSNSTPPPSYNEALVILATVPPKAQES